jgi:hypothetical protein
VKVWTYIIFKHQGQCQNDKENVKMWGKIGTMIGIKKTFEIQCGDGNNVMITKHLFPVWFPNALVIHPIMLIIHLN